MLVYEKMTIYRSYEPSQHIVLVRKLITSKISHSRYAQCNTKESPGKRKICTQSGGIC